MDPSTLDTTEVTNVVLPISPAQITVTEVIVEDEEGMKSKTFSFLNDEENHEVWRPAVYASHEITVDERSRKHTRFEKRKKTDYIASVRFPTKEVEKEKSASVKSLQVGNAFHKRQKTLLNRVNLVQQVLQTRKPSVSRWKVAAMKAADVAKQDRPPKLDLSSLVSRMVADQKKEQGVPDVHVLS